MSAFRPNPNNEQIIFESPVMLVSSYGLNLVVN